MKNFSENYSINEEARERVPVELYKIITDSLEQYYTDSDQIVTYKGDTYNPATIERGSISFNTQLEVSEVSINCGIIENPFYTFLTDHFHETITVEIFRYYIYNDSIANIFTGTLSNITLQGNSANATIIGIESFLNQTLPKYYYQPACNNKLFDSFCTLNSEDYDAIVNITNISADGLTLSGSFSSISNYLLFGQANINSEKRMIVKHSSTYIIVRFPFNNLNINDNITVFAGCNKTLSQCIARFNNKENYFGFPYIPKVNPAIKTRAYVGGM